MEDFMTIDDLSQKLQVSRVWLCKLVRQKRIPFFHIEKCVRFSPTEINQWLEERRGKVWHRDKKLSGVNDSSENLVVGK